MEIDNTVTINGGGGGVMPINTGGQVNGLFGTVTLWEAECDSEIADL